MMNKPDALLEEINTFLSVEDGDIIMTGTPKGVGIIKFQDVLLGKVFSGDKLLVERSWTVK